MVLSFPQRINPSHVIFITSSRTPELSAWADYETCGTYVAAPNLEEALEMHKQALIELEKKLKISKAL